MRHLAKASFAFAMMMLVLALPRTAAAMDEHLTDDELDLIRDAQELSQRVPVYLKLAEKRLAFLGLIEQSAEAKERNRRNGQRGRRKRKSRPTPRKPKPTRKRLLWKI